MKTTESILLYRYLPADSAIKTIEGKSFRVSRLRELNDPFEWVPGLDPVQPQAEDLAKWCMNRFLDQMNNVFGIISFSKEIHDSVLWGHYADSHRGIAFEVDHILNDCLHEVTYSDDRPVIDPRWIHDKQFETRLADTFMGFWHQKSSGWAYEKERRAIAKLKDCRTSGGMFFQDIPTDFLKRVILGVRCTAGAAYVRRALDLNGFASVEVVQASQDNKTYKIKC